VSSPPQGKSTPRSTSNARWRAPPSARNPSPSAAADPGAEIIFSVAVNRRGEVIPPCGPCRELLADYGARARVAVPGGADYAIMAADTLLPVPYKAHLRGAG
jgi:hypothetical protein